MTISATTQGLRPGVCTSTSRPSVPFDGMLIYETDTNRVAVYDTNAWVYKTPDTTAGSVLQVQSAVKTDTFATSLGAVWGDVTGLSVSITPKFSSSKILVIADVKGSGVNASTVVRSRLVRDSTAIYVGDAASSRPQGMGQFYIPVADQYYLAQLGGTFLDSPNTTSAVTYKVQIGADSNVLTVYINRTVGDRNNSYYDTRSASSITVMEIAQ